MEHKRRTKALSWLLSLAMALSLLPGMSLTALAEGHDHSTWTATGSLPTDAAGNYYLTADVTISSTWNVPTGETNLCLNGHGIRYSGSDNASVITVGLGATLNLYDCDTTTKHYITLNDAGRGTEVSGTTSDGAIEVTGGYITGGTGTTSDRYGGGVYVKAGTFTMYGGTIAGNTATRGGGVGVVYSQTPVSVFTMEGGTIENNTAVDYGGGVFNFGSTFNMKGGTINNNTANGSNYGYGGGVSNGGTFNMSGGTIKNNSANLFGGVRHDFGDFTMTGGEIVGNTANDFGGVHAKGSVTLSGNVTIKNNTAGGKASNLYLPNSAKINVTDALTDTASIGVTMENPGVFTSSPNTEKAKDYLAKFTSDDAAYQVLVDGDELKLASPHTHTIEEATVTFTAWDNADSLPTTAGNWYLENDVAISSTWTVPTGETNLCLNGHGIMYTGGGEASVITVGGGATLNLFDCDTTTKHYITLTNGRGTAVSDTTSEGAIEVTGGYITGGNKQSFDDGKCGGGVSVNGGAFTMSGGTIVGNVGYYGGGVCINGNSDHRGAFTMSGGSITGNKAGGGGGVYVFDGNTFTMSDGSISKNVSSSDGGGVRNSGTFTMSGGSITGNTTNYISSVGANKGLGGGGVHSTGTFTLSGAVTITGNKWKDAGSNVCLSTGYKIIIAGALTNATPIGVMMYNPGVFTSGSTDSLKASDFKEKFASEDSAYSVVADGNELKLGQPESLEAVSYREATYADDQVTYTTKTCDDYTVVTSSTTAWEDGKWYVVKDNVTISSRVGVTGTANLILCDGATLTAQYGISVNDSKTLNIYAGNTSEPIAGTGMLKALEYGGAGIGGNEGAYTCGAVNIHGGTIIAKGSAACAGIGGGVGAAGGNVTIYGGTVTATGGGVGAGIGGGTSNSGGSHGTGGNGGTVTIYGGTVYANGGNDYAVGIGGGGSTTGTPGDNGTLTLGAGVKLETSTDNSTWTDTTSDTSTRTRYMRTSCTSSGEPASEPASASVTSVTLDRTALSLTRGGTATLTATVAPVGAADKTVTWTSSNTGVATVDASGVVTAVAAGTATITVKTNVGGKTATCTVTVTSPASSSDDDGDDGSSTSASTTVSVPVSSDTKSVSVTAGVSGETATVQKPTTAQLEQIIGESVHTGEVTIDVSGLGKGITTASIPTETVKAVEQAVNDAANDATGMTVKLSEGSVTFDGQALTAITEQATGNNIQLNLDDIGENKLSNTQQAATKDMDVQAVYDAYLTSNGRRISDFKGGKATVTVPYELKAEQRAAGVTVWYVADNGEKTEMPSTYDGKDVEFTVEHFSNYVIAYDEERAAVCPQDSTCPISAFTDADPTAWYHDGVHYVLENGIMSGLGNGQFAPNDTTSRAMLAQILWNMEGKPAIRSGIPFEDVSESDWYAMAISWAESNGIIGGYGNGKFGPNDAVTREQLATILYRYAKYKGVDVSVGEDTNILSYDDAFDVSEWAIPAMQWAVGNGLISGRTASTLNPKDKATRAEIATIIMRYCENVAK